jgi:hypothetical protein
MNIETIIGTFHNALTGETIVRPLTAEEEASIPEPRKIHSDETSSAD